MVVTSPVMISCRLSVGTSSWAAKVVRTVFGDMGVFSLKMMAEGWVESTISTESGQGDVTE